MYMWNVKTIKTPTKQNKKTNKNRDVAEMCFFLTGVPKLTEVKKNKAKHDFLGDCDS